MSRIVSALVALSALVTAHAVAGALPCATEGYLLTDACCTAVPDEAPAQPRLQQACCCEVTPVSGDATAPDLSAVSGTSARSDTACAPAPVVTPPILFSIDDTPQVRARAPPPRAAGLLAQRTSLLR